MEYGKYRNRLLDFGGIKKINNYHFLIFFILIQIKGILLVYFDSFQTSMLNENASLIDISDYHNLYLIITTDNKIYSGIPPILKVDTNSSIINISSAVTYNHNYTLIACTDNYLLSAINIETGEEIYLVPYEYLNLPDSKCSLSAKDDYVYIGLSYIITDNSSTNSYLENTVIKIKLESNDGIPCLDTNFTILNYTFKYKDNDLDKAPIQKPFSCEIIDTDEDSRLICGHIKVKGTYICNATLLNSDFDDIEDEITIYLPSSIRNIRLQRQNSTHIKYIFTKCSFIVSLRKDSDKYKLVSTRDIPPFYEFLGAYDLFFYNNGYLFSASSNALYIKKNTTGNYIVAEDSDIVIEKIIGYKKQDEDLLLFIYEYVPNQIKYFTLENMDNLYSFEANKQIFEVKSGTTTIYNVSELVTSPVDHELLGLNSITYYISTKDKNNKYDKYNFTKEDQILIVEPSLNDWVSFSFHIEEEINGTSFKLILEKAVVTIKTCLFKCGQCNNSFYECDIGTCKTNFATYKDLDDQNCYPNDQNFPNYIYMIKPVIFLKNAILPVNFVLRKMIIVALHHIIVKYVKRDI